MSKRVPAERRVPAAAEIGSVLRRGFKAALARFILTRRRGAGPGGVPTARDEATHAWDGHARFAEDYTFVGVQAELGVVLRIEHHPARRSQRVWVVVLRPDGAWAVPGGQRIVPAAGDRWQAGGLSLDCIKPLRRWTLRFAGTLRRVGHGSEVPPLQVVPEGQSDPSTRRGSIELSFVSTLALHTPGADDDPELLAQRLGEARWDARLLRAVRRARPEGYVQLGELHGTIALDDERVPVQAAALRQHRWGVRDWGSTDEAFECFWARGDEYRAWVHRARFPFMTLDGGFVSLHERMAPVLRLGGTMDARPGRAPARVSLELADAEVEHAVEGTMVADLSLPVDGGAAVDLGLLRLTGSSEGWGLWAGLRTGVRVPPGAAG